MLRFRCGQYKSSTQTASVDWNVVEGADFLFSVTHSYSRLSKLSTARVSSTGLVMTGPTKVKACKSVQFTEGTPKVEIKNTCLMQLKQ